MSARWADGLSRWREPLRFIYFDTPPFVVHIISMELSPSSGPGSAGGSSKIYVCPTCKKTFGRRDYLDRHVLNRESTMTLCPLSTVGKGSLADQKPSEVCQHCGKAFARSDVLRKHLSTSCPVLKGQTPGPGPSSESKSVSRDRSSEKDPSTSKMASPVAPTPVRQARQSIKTERVEHDERDGQKRRRSSPNGSYVSTYTNGTTQMSNYWTRGLNEGLSSTNPVNPVHGSSASVGYTGHPAPYAPVAYTHSIPGSVGIAPPDAPLTQSVNPDLIGENMSELLQWLFQPPAQDPVPAPPPDPRGPPLPPPPPPPVGMYDLPRSGASTMPGSLSGNGTTPTNMAEPLDFSSMAYNTPPHPTDPSSQSPHKGNTAPLPISFVAPFPPVQEVQSKEPQPIHPYTHPNKWKAGLFPPFIERGPNRPMPPGRDVLGEGVRIEMLRLFDVSHAHYAS